MMEQQCIVMVMQTCQSFGEKMKTHGLAEFEVLMYEQCCRLVETWAKGHEMIAQGYNMGIERELDACREKHKKWEKERDERDKRRDSTPEEGDGDSDAGSGCTPEPVG